MAARPLDVPGDRRVPAMPEPPLSPLPLVVSGRRQAPLEAPAPQSAIGRHPRVRVLSLAQPSHPLERPIATQLECIPALSEGQCIQTLRLMSDTESQTLRPLAGKFSALFIQAAVSCGYADPQSRKNGPTNLDGYRVR